MPKTQQQVSSALNDLLIPKPIRRATLLQTNMAIGAAAVPGPEASPSSEPEGFDARWVDESAGMSDGPESSPPTLAILKSFTPAVGVYLMPATQGDGKTILSLGIAATANNAGIPAAYFSCFEPRSKPCTLTGKKRFSDARAFVADAGASIPKTSTLKLVIFDSATQPMKGMAAAWPNQATFAGGMQPSDRAFLNYMSELAEDRNACIILTMNLSLIPYVDQLEGAVEGQISPVDVAHFTYRDRTATSKRQSRTVELPIPIVNAALKLFGYGPYSGSMTSGALGFIGV
jgi:hypothetical protein